MTSWILVNIGAENGLLPDGTKPLTEPTLDLSLIETWKQMELKFNRHSNIFIHESAYEIVVCKMLAIFLGLTVL